LIALGLDIRDASTLALLVDQDGNIVSRGTDARTALGSRSADAIGVAVHDPSAEGVGAMASKAVGSAGTPHVVTRGAAVALAEQWRGAARDARLVVALTADEGVDAGIVLDGRLFGGAHGLAGAAGWLALNPVEREDYRKFGCLEAEVGAPGIVRRLVWRIKSGDRSRVLDMAGGNMNAITEQHVFDAARAGDGVAISVVRDTAKYIGMAVANLVAIVDPDVVVLGGVIAGAGDLLLEPTRTEMTRRVSGTASSQVRVVPAALGDDAAAIGAARAGMHAGQ
jgi:glucokinase